MRVHSKRRRTAGGGQRTCLWGNETQRQAGNWLSVVFIVCSFMFPDANGRRLAGRQGAALNMNLVFLDIIHVDRILEFVLKAGGDISHVHLYAGVIYVVHPIIAISCRLCFNCIFLTTPQTAVKMYNFLPPATNFKIRQHIRKRVYVRCDYFPKYTTTG